MFSFAAIFGVSDKIFWPDFLRNKDLFEMSSSLLIASTRKCPHLCINEKLDLSGKIVSYVMAICEFGICAQ